MLIIGKKKKNKMRVKKILILGASSDIGIEVIKLLIKNNWIISQCLLRAKFREIMEI